MKAVKKAFPFANIKHRFACDILHASHQWVKQNFDVDTWYDDVQSPAFAKNSMYVDLLFAGFPCQPFSDMGKHEGTEDSKGRGTIIYDIVKYISRACPRAFCLENVKGLLTHHSETLLGILKMLRVIKNKEGRLMYTVLWKLLDSKDYGGVPQRRPRLYIVGFKKKGSKKFEWPAKVPQQPLRKLLEKLPKTPKKSVLPSAPAAAQKVKDILKELRGQGIQPLKVPVVIDCDASRPRWLADITPCLTATRTAGGGFWVTCQNRRFTLRELFALQGMDLDTWRRPEDLSDRKIGHMVGNAYTMTVIENIVKALAKATQLQIES